MFIERECEWCKKNFRAQIRTDRPTKGRFCSPQCFINTLKRRVKKKCLYCKRQFEVAKSKIGRYCSAKCRDTRRGIALSGVNHWCWGKKRLDITGEKNWKWKGNKVSYGALHSWIRRRLGKPKRCEHCGKDGVGRHMHWANKSGKYLRNTSDWIRLCVPCHKKYDKNL